MNTLKSLSIGISFITLFSACVSGGGSTTSNGSTSNSALSSQSTSNTTPTQSLTISPNTQNISVNESINFFATGGTSPYTFSIYSGQGTISASTGIFTASSQAGSATIQVRDASGTLAYAYLVINSVSDLVLNPSNVEMDVNTTYSFTASGGTAPYTYSVTSGLGSFNGSIFQAGSSSGAVTIKVTDAIGRTQTGTINVISLSSSDIASADLLIHASKYLGLSWDNTTNSTHPSLVLYGMGSTISASNIGNSASFCTYNGYIQRYCGLRLELHNLNKSDSTSNVYKGTVIITGDASAIQMEFCIVPANKNKAYIRWTSGTHVAATNRFNATGKIFIEGKQSLADHVVVHSGSNTGNVHVQIQNAAYTNDSSCGSGFSTSTYVETIN